MRRVVNKCLKLDLTQDDNLESFEVQPPFQTYHEALDQEAYINHQSLPSNTQVERFDSDPLEGGEEFTFKHAQIVSHGFQQQSASPSQHAKRPATYRVSPYPNVNSASYENISGSSGG